MADLIETLSKKKKKEALAAIKTGADVNVRGPEGITPVIALADGLRDLEILNALVEKGADLNAVADKYCHLQTALHRAVTLPKLDFAERLLAAGADIEVRDAKNQDTPLTRLCRSHSGVMNATEESNALWLLEKGANPIALNKIEETPLHLAARSGSLKIAKALVARGAKITETKFGETPLFYAMYADISELGEYLLSLGEQVNHRNKRGVTPLKTAVSYRKIKAATLLLAHGADVNAADDKGQTPLTLARSYEDPKWASLLEKG